MDASGGEGRSSGRVLLDVKLACPSVSAVGRASHNGRHFCLHVHLPLVVWSHEHRRHNLDISLFPSSNVMAL